LGATDPGKKIWTILELVTWGTGYLAEKKIDDARLNIELLLAHVLQLQRIQLYTKYDQPLKEQELAQFKSLLKRRLANEPLQYILGQTEFMGLRFSVDPGVLIPRPETELLVDHALSLIKQRFAAAEQLRILDLGTGSGCIAVSLAVKLPHSVVTAVDISEAACATASRNADKNGVLDRVTILKEDMMNLKQELFPQKFHCILSNPPYVSKKEMEFVAPEVRMFEPHEALTDNENGLKFYPEIAHFAKGALTENGFIGVEHAFDQSDSVRNIFTHEGFSGEQIVKDYQGINRHIFFSGH
jgi:release factor glutamine methyltransferase